MYVVVAAGWAGPADLPKSAGCRQLGIETKPSRCHQIHGRNVSVPGKGRPHGARSAPEGGGLGGLAYPSSSVLEGVGRALRIPIYMAHILGAGASKNCLGSRDRVICNEFCEVRSPWVH